MFYHVECGERSKAIDAETEIKAAIKFLQELVVSGEKSFGVLIAVSKNQFCLDENSRFWTTENILSEIGIESEDNRIGLRMFNA